MTSHTRFARPPRKSTPLRLEVLEDRTLPAVSVLQNFPDINFTQTSLGTPPDTQMAVGPSTVVGAVNTAITVQNAKTPRSSARVSGLVPSAGIVAEVTP